MITLAYPCHPWSQMLNNLFVHNFVDHNFVNNDYF